jgi:hypothetical protein
MVHCVKIWHAVRWWTHLYVWALKPSVLSVKTQSYEHKILIQPESCCKLLDVGIDMYTKWHKNMYAIVCYPPPGTCFRRVPTKRLYAILFFGRSEQYDNHWAHVGDFYFYVDLKLWQVVWVSSACAQILNGTFVSTPYTQKLDDWYLAKHKLLQKVA